LANRLNPNVGHGELAYIYNHLGLEDLAARELALASDVDPTMRFQGKSSEAVKWLRDCAVTEFHLYPRYTRDAFLNRIRQSAEFTAVPRGDESRERQVPARIFLSGGARTRRAIPA